MRAEPSLAYYERAVRAVRAGDAGDPAPAGAGDRARAGHRHRGRLPAGGDVRPGGGRARRALRRQRRQPRAVLLDAERGAVAQPVAQGGVRDAGDRRLHLRRARRWPRASSTASPTPTRSTPRSRRWSPRIVAKPRVALAMGKALFYRQLETGIAAAYDDAGQTMACNMMDDARARRRAGLHRQAPAELGHAARMSARAARSGGAGSACAAARGLRAGRTCRGPKRCCRRLRQIVAKAADDGLDPADYRDLPPRRGHAALPAPPASRPRAREGARLSSSAHRRDDEHRRRAAGRRGRGPPAAGGGAT